MTDRDALDTSLEKAAGGRFAGPIANLGEMAVKSSQPPSLAYEYATQSLAASGATELLQGPLRRRGEASIAPGPMATRFFVRLVLLIALADRFRGGIFACGRGDRRGCKSGDSCFHARSIAAGLLFPDFLAVRGGSIALVREPALPAPRSSSAFVAAVAIERMVGAKTPFATLQ
jgi:hypothetical protein